LFCFVEVEVVDPPLPIYMSPPFLLLKK